MNNPEIEALDKKLMNFNGNKIELEKTGRVAEIDNLLSTVDQAFCEFEKNFKEGVIESDYCEN